MSEAIVTRVVVDDKQLVDYVNAVTREQKRTLKKAYNEAIKPLIKDARRNVRASKYKLKKSNLVKGVRGGTWKNNKGASVYIRSPYDNYYKLLFFESGTKERFVKMRKRKRLKTKAGRGRIVSGWFFRNALTKHARTMGERFDEVLRQALNNVKK